MDNITELVTIRPGKLADKNYILSTWSKGILDAPPFRWMSDTVWRKHHALMESALVRGCVAVAANREDEDQILGYVVFEPGDGFTVVHWTYVKKLFRGRGIGSLLLRTATSGAPDTRFTHYSRQSRDFIEKSGATYDPFYVWL